MTRERMRWAKARVPGATHLGFGRFRGFALPDVPTWYVEYLARIRAFLPALREKALAELERRRMEPGSVAEVRDLLADPRARRARGRA